MRIGKTMKLSCAALLMVSMLFIQGCMGSEPGHNHHGIDINKAMGKEKVVSLAILGGGIAGYSAAIYGARGMVSTLVIQGSKPGGLLNLTTEVENWPGERTIMGPVLIDKIHDHAKDLGAQFLLDSVERIDFSSWPYKLYTEDGKVIHALSIIVATGATPSYLGIPGEQEYLGRGVGTCAVCDAAFYKGEDVVVVGGGDSAIEEAIQLSPHAKMVTILVRKDRMRAAARMQAKLKDYPNVKVIYNIDVKKVIGDEKHVTGLEVFNNKTQETSEIPVNGFFLAIGHTPNSQMFSEHVIKSRLDAAHVCLFGRKVGVPESGFIRNSAEYAAKYLMQGKFLETNERGFIKTLGRTQKTSIPGVFVAGEVEDERYRQAIVESGRGVSAALDALAFLSDIGLTPAISAKLAQQSETEKPLVAESKPLEGLKSLEQLNQLSQTDGSPIILDFYGPNCMPCKQALPMIESVAQQFDGRARFYKVNSDEAVDLVEKFVVHKVPYFIVIKNGKLAGRYGNNESEGLKRSEFVEFVEQFLDAPQPTQPEVAQSEPAQQVTTK